MKSIVVRSIEVSRSTRPWVLKSYESCLTAKSISNFSGINNSFRLTFLVVLQSNPQSLSQRKQIVLSNL